MKEVLNEKRRALFAKYSSVKAGGIAASADETEVVANSQLSCNDGPDGRELAQILTVYTKSDIPIPIKIVTFD